MGIIICRILKFRRGNAEHPAFEELTPAQIFSHIHKGVLELILLIFWNGFKLLLSFPVFFVFRRIRTLGFLLPLFPVLHVQLLKPHGKFLFTELGQFKLVFIFLDPFLYLIFRAQALISLIVEIPLYV